MHVGFKAKMGNMELNFNGCLEIKQNTTIHLHAGHKEQYKGENVKEWRHGKLGALGNMQEDLICIP